MAAHFLFLSWLSWITIICCRWLSYPIITHCQKQKEPLWVACRSLGKGPCWVAGACLFPFISNFDPWLPALPDLAIHHPAVCQCGGGEGREERQVGQEEWDRNVITSAWQEESENMARGGGRHEQGDTDSFCLVPLVKAGGSEWTHGSAVLCLFPHRWGFPTADGTFEPQKGRTVSW